MLVFNVDFAGSVQIDANDITFQYIGTDEKVKGIITGTEWHQLTPEQKSEYIIESMADTVKKCFDESWDEISITVESENND